MVFRKAHVNPRSVILCKNLGFVAQFIFFPRLQFHNEIQHAIWYNFLKTSEEKAKQFFQQGIAISQTSNFFSGFSLNLMHKNTSGTATD